MTGTKNLGRIALKRMVARRREDVIAAARIIANTPSTVVGQSENHVRSQRQALKIVVNAYDAHRTMLLGDRT